MFDIEIDCGAPPAPSLYGNVRMHGTKLHDTASYYCNPGYFLRGSKTIYCQPDKRWSDTAPQCKG